MILVLTASFKLRASMVVRSQFTGKMSIWPFKDDEFEKFKFNQTMELEHAKLEIEQTKLKENREIEQTKLKDNREIEHAKLKDNREIEHAKLKQIHEIERSRQLTLVVLSGIFFLLIKQIFIYLRDGILGKKSGNVAIFTSLSVALGQITQGSESVVKFVRWIIPWFYRKIPRKSM